MKTSNLILIMALLIVVKAAYLNHKKQKFQIEYQDKYLQIAAVCLNTASAEATRYQKLYIKEAIKNEKLTK